MIVKLPKKVIKPRTELQTLTTNINYSIFQLKGMKSHLCYLKYTSKLLQETKKIEISTINLHLSTINTEIDILIEQFKLELKAAKKRITIS